MRWFAPEPSHPLRLPPLSDAPLQGTVCVTWWHRSREFGRIRTEAFPSRGQALRIVNPSITLLRSLLNLLAERPVHTLE